MPDQTIRILHTNDLHGTLDQRRVDILKPVRQQCDLYFDTGDCIKTGNLGIPLRPEPVWNYLAELNCIASVPGNRESHVLRSALDAKLAGHQHPILCANLYDKANQRILPSSLTLEIQNLTVGIFGVMVPMVTQKMKSQRLSQMLWTQPIPEAIQIAKELRQTCDLVIALTHIGNRQDQALAESTNDIDLILGGHSHTVLETPTQVNKTWICQTGSHGCLYGEYEWRPETGLTSAQLTSWLKLL